MATNAVLKSRNPRYYFGLLARWLWFILLCALLGGGGAYAASRLQTPIYRATTVLIVDQRTSSADTYTGLLASNQLVTDYVGLITQPVVLDKAASQLKFKGVSGATLSSRVQVTSQSQTIQIMADDANPQRAAQTANAVASAFITVLQQSTLNQLNTTSQQLNQQLTQVLGQINTLTQNIATLKANNPNDPGISTLEQQLTLAETQRNSLQSLTNQLALQYASNNGVRIFQPATVPDSPDHPSPVFNAMIGAALGLILAFCIVLLREFFDDRIRTAAQIEDSLGLPTIGIIPLISNRDIRHARQSDAFLIDSLRIIRTNLRFLSLDKPLRSISIVSPEPYEGKTTVAINLAISLAQSGRRVLLVDADLRRPSIHQRLGLQNIDGLTLVLLQEQQKISFAAVPEHPNLFFLPAGPKPPNPTELLESERMYKLIQSVLTPSRTDTPIDVIIFDTPPLLSFADGAVLAGYVDGVIFVANALMSRESALRQAAESLKRAKARIIGVILSSVKPSKRSSKYYYDYKPASAKDLATSSALLSRTQSSGTPATKDEVASDEEREREEDNGEDTLTNDTDTTMVLPQVVPHSSKAE